jgi:hypothetical protein
MELPWVSLPKCRPCSRAAEDGHGAESSFTGPEPEDLPPQPLWSPRWICSLCRRSVSGSSMRSLILHHDVDASYQWRSHPIRRPNGLHGRSPVAAGANPHFFGGTARCRGSQPNTSAGRVWLTSEPCKGGLSMAPPSAADGLDRARRPAVVGHQGFYVEERLTLPQILCHFFPCRQKSADFNRRSHRRRALCGQSPGAGAGPAHATSVQPDHGRHLSVDRSLNPPRWSTTTISTASMRTSGHSS